MIGPSDMNRRGPYCMDSRPMRGERKNMTTVTGSSEMPARSAEKPANSIRYSVRNVVSAESPP